MGCRILVGTECGEDSQTTQACFYCSTVGLAFGPMFDGEGFDGDPQKEAMAFIAYLEEEGVKDPRAIPNRELMAYFGTFARSNSEGISSVF